MSVELPSSEEEVQAMLESAVARRASHIRKEAETITMANVRRLLESDLGLEKSALDAHKVSIRQLVDAVLLSSENAETEEEELVPEEISKRTKKSSGKKKAREENGSADQTKEKSSKSLQEKDYEEAPKRKKQKKDEVQKENSYKNEEDEESGGSHAEASVSVSEEEVHVEAPKSKSQKSKPRKEEEEIEEVDENGGRSHSEMSDEDSDVSERRKAKKVTPKVSSVKPVQNKRIEYLKKIIKACGLTIPPQIYKRVKQQPDDKHDKYLIKELEDMLSRQGLSSDPSEKEIKAAKKRIAREKDMEGIDTTNIISEPRGRRAASQFFAPVYNPPPMEYDSELDDDGEQDEEDESDNAANGSEDEKDFAAADDTDNSE